MVSNVTDCISCLWTLINTCRKVPWQVNVLDNDILHCLLCVLSFYGRYNTLIFLLFLALIASWKRCWCTRQTEGRRIQCTRNIQDRQNRQTVRLSNSNTADRDSISDRVDWPAGLLVVKSTTVWRYENSWQRQAEQQKASNRRSPIRGKGQKTGSITDRWLAREITWTTDSMTGMYRVRLQYR